MNSTRIAVEVQDTGAGIDPSNLGRIFEPFEQAGPRTHRWLSLGLSISPALADAQDATLTAESGGHGRGATFRLELEALPDLAPAAPAPAPASRAFALESRRVRRSSEAGFVDHLVKPITLGRLEEAIDRFFDRRQTADRVS